LTALAADANYIGVQRENTINYPVADNVVIYKNSLVCLNTSGYAVPAADTASYVCVGIAVSKVDNTVTGHTAGGKRIDVRSGVNVKHLVTSGATQASVGTTYFVTDSATVATSSTNSVVAGICSGFNSATDIDVFIPLAPNGVSGIAGLTATASELNELHSVTPGTASASKAAVLGASKNLDTLVINGTGANALAVGPNGTTNPAFNVDNSTASAATGLNIKAAAAGGGVAESVLSSGTNESWTMNAKGSGSIIIGNTSTGIVVLGRGAASAVVFGNTKATISTQNITPTAAQIVGGIIEHATTTGAGTATLDTAANIDAALPSVTTGDTFDVLFANTGTQTSTITTNTGLTLKGTAAVPSGKNAMLTFFRTGSAAWTVYITVSA
jgi:hypothetical protein